jgi:ribose transport system permease protein
VAIWIAILAFIVAGVYMYLMPGGRHLYAIGVNKEAAFLSGVNTKRTPYILYIVSGASAGLAGAIYAARLNSAPAGQLGTGFELVVLTAILLGGVSLLGGEGTIFGVLTGVLFLGLLGNGLILIGVASFWQNVASGVALILAIGLSVVTHKLRGVFRDRENKQMTDTLN